MVGEPAGVVLDDELDVGAEWKRQVRDFVAGGEIHQDGDVQVGHEVEQEILELIFLGAVDRQLAEDDPADPANDIDIYYVSGATGPTQVDLQAGTSSGEGIGSDTVTDFEKELGMTLVPERVERMLGPEPRVEVLGTLKEAGQVRTVLVV